MAEKIDFSDIDKILSSQEDESNSSQQNTSNHNKKVLKKDLKPPTPAEGIQALFDEGKGKYVVIPAVAGGTGAYLKHRYDKKVLESLKEFAKIRGEERSLIRMIEGNRGGLGIASGSSAVKGVPFDKLKLFDISGRPLTRMSIPEIAQSAKTEGLARTVVPFYSSLRGIKPQALAESAEFPETFSKYILQQNRPVEVGKPTSEVLGALGKYGKHINRVALGLTGLSNIPKALNTGNLYNYYTEDLRRGIDPNGHTEYLGMNIPNSVLIDYLAPIGGGLKAYQNIAEVSRDVVTRGLFGLARDYVVNPLLQYDKKLTEDQEKIKTKLIEEYTAKGLNPIQAERFAKNHLIAQENPSELSDEEYKKRKALSDSFSNSVLSLLNAEIPPE